MADLWILDKEDNLLAILSSDAGNACAFWDDVFREELNQGSTFKFTCNASHPDSKYIAKLNQVVFKDKDGFFRLFKIREIDRGNGDDGPNKTAHCEPAEMELLEWIIDDVRPQNTTQQDALNRALAGTRWTGNVTASNGINSTNFYHISAYEAITDIINVWGGELMFTVTFDMKSNKVIDRVVNILPRRGSDTGARFEVGYNIQDIHVTEMAYPVSALWGWGGSIEDEDGNNSRFIDFSEVEWKKSNGDPVDKPKGQKWVEYPPAKEKYGYKKTDGTVINAFGKWQNENIKDSKELLEKTYDQLVNAASQIQTNYALDVELSSDPVELGDTGLALDRTVAESIEFSGRIIALEYSISDPEGTAKVEMGQFLSVYEPDTRIDEIEDRIKDIERGRDIVVDDNSFPDIKPPTPQKVEVKGLFASVALLWEFDSSSYIATYEVYGSQRKDFAPDTTNFSNRLWRGKEGGWVHDSDVNQVWYYRIRAVNTRGTASDFTGQFSATTVRIGTNHIENQSITNALIKDLSADKITVGTLVGINIRASILTGSRLEFADPDPYNVSYVTGSEIFMRRRDSSDNSIFSFFNVKEGKVTTKGGKITGSSSTISIQRGELIATSTYNDYGIKLSAPEGEYGGTKLEFFSGDPSNSSDSIGWMGVQGSHLSISTLNNRSLFVSMENIRVGSGYLRLDGPTGDGTNASAIFNVNDQQNYVDLSSTGNVGVRIFGGKKGLNLYGVNYISGFGGGKTIKFENSGEILLNDKRSNTDFHIGRDSTGPRIYSNAIYKRTYSSAANLYITGAGTLGRVTSASKYKMNVEGLPSDRYEKVLDLIPKTWYDKQAVEEYSKALSEGNEEAALNDNDIPHVERIPGLIAEDVYNAGLKEFVSFGPPDANGNREIEGLMYDRIYVLLIPLVKDLKKRIEILESGLN